MPLYPVIRTRWQKRTADGTVHNVILETQRSGFNVKSILLIRKTNSSTPRPAEEQRHVLCNWSELKSQLTLSGLPPQRGSWHNSEAIRIQWYEKYFWCKLHEMDRYQKIARWCHSTRIDAISVVRNKLFKLEYLFSKATNGSQERLITKSSYPKTLTR